MQSIQKIILTDLSVRELEAVEAQLVEEFGAGSPWFNEE